MTYDTHNTYADDYRLEKEQRFWKEAAKGYDKWMDTDFKDQYVVNWEVLKRCIEPGHQVLDVGCGPGDLSIRLSKRCREVRGVDVTHEMIRITQLVDLLRINGFDVVEAEKIREGPVVAFLRGKSIVF